jgi:hypothetical protein
MIHDIHLNTFQTVLSIDFMNLPINSSNIVQGKNVNFNTKCSFKFKIDEFSIKYLESNCINIELYALSPTEP